MPACQEFMARFSAQSDPNCVEVRMSIIIIIYIYYKIS